MSKQSPFRTIKNWERYEPKDRLNEVSLGTRGIYVLYQYKSVKNYEVVYIGVAGLGKTGRGSIRSRLRTHKRRIKDWSHFSFFEVHDNITSDEIRELETLLLCIFRHDPRVKLANKQSGSTKLRRLLKTKKFE